MTIFRNPTNPKGSSTLYNVISSLVSPTLSPTEKIEAGRKYIFNFDYVTPEGVNKEEFKQYFETAFIGEFLTRYFAYNSFELWQIKLRSKMLLVMPDYVNKLSAYFNDVEYGTVTETSGTNEGKTTNKQKTVSADLPIGIIDTNAIGSVKYADNGSLTESETDNNNTNTSKTVVKSLDMLIKYNEQFSGLFTSLMREFDSMFSVVIP